MPKGCRRNIISEITSYWREIPFNIPCSCAIMVVERKQEHSAIMERKPYSGNRGYSASSRSGSADHSRTSQPRSGRPQPERYGRSGEAPRRPARSGEYSDVRRKASNRARRRKRSVKDLVPLLLLLCAVAAIAYFFLSTWLTVKLNDSTYCANVYVNGVELDKLGKDEGVEAVHQALYQRLNQSFTLTAQGKSWSFKPADFDASIDADAYLERAWNIGHVGGIFDRKSTISELTDNPVHFNAPLEYDEALIEAFLADIAQELYIAPVDAQVTLSIDRPYLSGQSSVGQELDTQTAKEMICSLIETGEGGTQLPLLELQPAVSSDAAEGGMDLIVEYSTDTTFRRGASRNNIKKALGYFNAYAVYPGDTVDFNAVVGPRTEARGFELATEYAGNTSTQGVGGGICQASSTLYGAVMIAGMDIIERHNHSMTVSYVEPSLDAAVTDTGFKNFIFQNNTEHAIYIYTHVDKETATVTIYGNRPQYRCELESKIVRQDVDCTYVSYIPDESGKYCYYTTETKIHTKGHPALSSEGWSVYYDWETGEEVKRSQLSFDIYESGTNIYWRGIHDPVTGEIVDYQNW